MMRFYVMLISACLPGVLSQCSVEKAQQILKQSVNEFAIELMARIAEDKDNNFIVSPLSPWTMLASASLGADGVTLDELKKVLKLHDYQCFNERYSEVIQVVTTDDLTDTMERSFNIFVDEKLGLNSCFQKKIENAGITNIDMLPVDNTEIIAKSINDCVARATYNTTLEFAVPSGLDDVNLVMANATYFKGLWQIPFPYENTQVKPFYNELGVQIGYVNMMSLTGTFNMSYISQINAQVLELPYGTDGMFSMLVFLPDQNSSLSVLINSLKRINLTTIYETFERDSMQSVYVELPRFKIASDLNLKDLLTDMGLRRAFDSEQAEFPLISPYNLYISNFVQDASIEVNEEGTIASAARETDFSAKVSLKSSINNRPFLYILQDRKSGLTFFVGSLVKVRGGVPLVHNN